MENVKKIARIGQGYVGLPLAIAFSYHYKVVGYDINQQRIEDLNAGVDKTLETNIDELNIQLVLGKDKLSSIGYFPTSNIDEIKDSTIYIITVPTPIDHFNAPDLSYLISASKIVGQVLKPQDIVIYESTVYPGCTEEDCVPVLEDESGLIFNKDFFVGY